MKLLKFFSEEPVRIYCYSVVAALVALLVVLGVVGAPLVPTILTLVTTVLAIPAAEVTRSKVTFNPDSALAAEDNPPINDDAEAPAPPAS